MRTNSGVVFTEMTSDESIHLLLASDFRDVEIELLLDKADPSKHGVRTKYIETAGISLDLFLPLLYKIRRGVLAARLIKVPLGNVEAFRVKWI